MSRGATTSLYWSDETLERCPVSEVWDGTGTRGGTGRGQEGEGGDRRGRRGRRKKEEGGESTKGHKTNRPTRQDDVLLRKVP